MMQSDSIHINSEAGAEQIVQKHYQPTPAQILSWLPKNATPAQQDSAIQRHIRPTEIHWSTRPDTLHLPGHPVGKSILDTSLPQYYKESFFSNKQYFHPEIEGGRQGIAGDPIPYTIAGDNFMSSVILICLMAAIVAVSNSKAFIARQFKAFFYTNANTREIIETSLEIRSQLFLIAESCILFAILAFLYFKTTMGDSFVIEQSQMIFLFAGVFASYITSKYLFYSITNWALFDKKNNQQWLRSSLFLNATEGMVIFPLVLVQSFFDISIANAVIYMGFVIISIKLLSFYKARQIFFNQNGCFLQNILYLCALELVPLSILGYALVKISEMLKINF